MANITVLEALQLSLNATKKYVDDKTEILPVANKYIVFKDAVPHFQEEVYIFDNLQNEEMIPGSVDGELTISFNDGTEDITKTTTFRNHDDNYADSMDYLDNFEIHLSYSENTNSFAASVIKWVSNENGEQEHIPCTVTKGTFVCNVYSNLIEDYLISNIMYEQISNVPIELQYLTDGRNETLRSKEYYNLYDNSFVWDMNKINERLDENSGVTQNTFVTTYNGKAIKVNQKDSEGIGFGQLVPIKRDKNVCIFVRAQQDVIIKVYNPNTKELIFTMEDIYINSFRYAKYSIPFHQVRDIDNIFIAFTIKDIPTDSFSNNTIYDLMVIDESTFLKKEEVLTKANTKEYAPTGDYNPATKKYVDDKVAGVNASMITGLATVATSGSYNDLTNKPTIPIKTSELTNDSGFTTKEYVDNYPSDIKVITTEATSVYTFMQEFKDSSMPIPGIYYLRPTNSISYNIDGSMVSIYGIFQVYYKDDNLHFAFHDINAQFFFTADNSLYGSTIFARKGHVLTKTNTTAYTPTSDYHPATKLYVDEKVADIVDSAPETLDTLKELSTALGNDPNFATTIANQIGTKVDKVDSKGLSTNDLTNELKANYDAAYTHSTSAHAPSNAQANADITKAEIEAKLTGDITSHTHNQYLTEHQDISGLAPKANPSFTGNATVAGKVTVGTAPTENMDVATKQYVDDAVAAADYGPYSIRYNSENNRLEFIYTPTN